MTLFESQIAIYLAIAGATIMFCAFAIILPIGLHTRRLRQKLALAHEHSRQLQSQSESIQKELSELRNRHHQTSERLTASEKECATATERAANLLEKLSDQREEFARQRDEAKIQFENLATRILDQSSQKLEISSQKGLANILSPLQSRIRDFEQKVSDTYDREARERFALKAELEKMILANQKISEDATNLTQALRGDVKQQGNWGELKLEMILEKSGLKSGEEYVREAKDLRLKDQTGRSQRPDVIVYLPDDKHIIVDSKVSLNAYERFTSSSDPDERLVFRKDFYKSMKTHIDGLSAKQYEMIEGLGSPDFVLMFCAIESAFSMLMEEDQDLLTYAWDRRVMLVTPTTLLAGLRTISSLWKSERQNKNAMEIARQGGALYDKFAAFVGDIEKIGKGLSDTQKSYDLALNKLTTGRGNLITRTEKLKELGAKAAKKLELSETPATTD